MLTTFFGIVYAGGFYVLIDPSFPKERVMKIFNVLKPSVVITDEDKLIESGNVSTKEQFLILILLKKILMKPCFRQ